MSDYLPFEIQSEIMKRLPAKSLVQFRSVSKQWMSFIDCPEFINTYHINHTNPQHHLLVEYNHVPTYTSIIDDNTFPQQKFPLTAPETFRLLREKTMLGSVDGLLGFYGVYKDVDLETKMVVLWNPSLRKCVGIPISDVVGFTYVGFGVCSDTSDPKLVKINVVETPSRYFEVQVFTLSSRVWRTVYTGAPFKLCDLKWDCVFIDGIIYWLTHHRLIISFDLKSEKFGEICLPRSIRMYAIRVVKGNESLGLLEYYPESGAGGLWVCGVWMRKDGVNKPFTKIYTVEVEGKSVFNRVLGFRNNGEVVLQLDDHYDFWGSQMDVYEPSSGCINSVGISGRHCTFSAWSYMETLLLIDRSNSIIY